MQGRGLWGCKARVHWSGGRVGGWVWARARLVLVWFPFCLPAKG